MNIQQTKNGKSPKDTKSSARVYYLRILVLFSVLIVTAAIAVLAYNTYEEYFDDMSQQNTYIYGDNEYSPQEDPIYYDYISPPPHD